MRCCLPASARAYLLFRTGKGCALKTAGSVGQAQLDPRLGRSPTTALRVQLSLSRQARPWPRCRLSSYLLAPWNGVCAVLRHTLGIHLARFALNIDMHHSDRLERISRKQKPKTQRKKQKEKRKGCAEQLHGMVWHGMILVCCSAARQ